MNRKKTLGDTIIEGIGWLWLKLFWRKKRISKQLKPIDFSCMFPGNSEDPKKIKNKEGQ